VYIYLLSWIVLGALAGLITGQILRGNQYGPTMDLVIGVAGAVGGGFLAIYGGLPGHFEVVSTTLSAILGAVALTAVMAFVNGRKRYA
jgi:uncharacterized membrane protein YeaQ/YmgE (transglycosylase-associated protein family)